MWSMLSMTFTLEAMDFLTEGMANEFCPGKVVSLLREVNIGIGY